jgi:hypothetical protein
MTPTITVARATVTAISNGRLREIIRCEKWLAAEQEMSMTEPIAFLRRLASPRRGAPLRGAPAAIALLLRVGLAGMLTWIGYIHLHLWQEGYRQIPTNGPLFLLDALAAFVLAAALLAWPRPLAGLLATGFTAGTIGALLISLSVGLFGFKESISASYVVESLVIESVTVLGLAAWTVLVAARVPPAGSRDGSAERRAKAAA